ncbi:protein of unknown function [Halopseudomonas litoralis]|uniref:DUF4389 domain-containing protein n=1 Tax=Halopseudomonas litoralis TaxID=797277 RepID=A0A1H1S2Y2_9GAMM|nr:DUF4389 domain-containing protein [Halopseudomonas litoralis]SDS42158.1 protein of unknown function [Halopseudomonas litoralis]
MNAFKENITSADFWLRLVYTLLFALAWQVVEVLLAAILVLQIVLRLFTGEPNAQLAGFGNSLSQYAWQMGRYVSGAAEEKPWPFMEWPAEDGEWQPKPPEGPVTVDPVSDSAVVPPVTPVPPAAPVTPSTPATPAVSETGAVEPPVVPDVVDPIVDVEADADLPVPPEHVADTSEPEPPILQPSDMDDPGAAPGDGSRLKP